MNHSELIVHSTNHRIYCCCYCWQAVVCFASNKSLQLWDILSGTKINKFDYGQQLAPISINIVSQQEGNAIFLLQDKSGQMLTIEYKLTKQLLLLNSYQIESIGFTKLCTSLYVYNEGGKVQRRNSLFFCTIFNRQEIQQRNLIDGRVKKRFVCQNVKFGDVTATLQLQIQNHSYFLMAEQGNVVNRANLADLLIKQMKRIQIESKEEIKIVLQFEPINNFRAVVVLRQDRLVIINLKEVTVEMDFMAVNFVRRIRELESGKRFAFSGKKRIGIIEDGKVTKNQQLHTQLIMDLDVCGWGVVGVTEQGKLFALPL